ncbi:MAG TPA: zf-HC2 domain-containing protein [Spirochaetota bacterium]|nr:zf-HC2 domain-containing protein [Spirochaetota bacterium]
MKCRDARELINSYIDNGLDPEKDKFLMEHVKKCSRCSEELRFLIVYRKTVKKIKPVKAPTGFMSELNKRIELEQNSLFRNYFNKTLDAWHHFTFPVEAVGVIAVALLIFFLYTPLFHDTKKISSFNEDQVFTETKSKSMDEQIKEKRRLLPPAAEKKKRMKRPSVSSEKDITGAEETADSIFMDEDKSSAVLDDTAPVRSSQKTGKALYDFDSDKAAGAISTESFKKEEAAENRRKSGSANEIRRPSSVTPEIIITESEGTIIIKSSGRYIVKIEEDKLSALADKLKKNYSATYKITGRSGSTLTVEFLISE